jgi:hypothetical protein
MVKSFLVPCPSCARHARAADVRCPFCDAHLGAESAQPPHARLAQATRLALTASAVTLAACSSSPGNLFPPYGHAPEFDSGDVVEDAGVTSDASDAEATDGKAPDATTASDSGDGSAAAEQDASAGDAGAGD